jgi:hypothetical protein
MAAAADTNAPPQTDVPVRKVVLYSSGVGYFEHGGKVANNAVAELRFKTSQINDMLKSLVLEDLDGGAVTTVVYPSLDPLSKTLRSFQVDVSGNPALGELLGQLRGATVTVAAGSEEVTGVILGVESRTRTDSDGRVLETEWWLNLLAGGTIRSFKLTDLRRIELQDPQLREELNKALAAVAQARDQDKKPVAINFSGKGDRRVRVGYVVETPIWKTSYRLVMPEGDAKTGKLQGWAIVENQTESDWNEVMLSLVSGRPISFVQDLYQPLYVPRPVVQPELYASLSPQAYGAGMVETELAAPMPEQRRGGLGGGAGAPPAAAKRMRSMEADKIAPAAPAMVGRADSFAADASADGFADTFLNISASVASLATAEDVGELFEYTVPNVSLPRQRSAMIPIVTDDVEVERVSIYNEQIMAKYPLNGARFKNTTGKHLLQGPITVLDDSAYAGDARIEDLPENQERLLSYAVDLNVHVDATKNRQDTAIMSGKIVKGILEVTRKNLFQKEYQFDNKGEKDRTIVIEHPFRGDWKLVDSPKPIETTDRVYRFKETVKAGEKKAVTVKEEHVFSESVAILNSDFGALQFYAAAGEIPKKVRDALARAVELRSAMVDTERKIQQHNERIAQITAEQERIRNNMKTVDRNTEYSARLLTKLNDQESEIEKLQSELKGFQDTLNKQRSELENYLMSLSIE